MSETKVLVGLPRPYASIVADPRVQVATFAVSIFVSALLLFSVQPMFARMVLPKLGGAPAVWAISMCFFQAVLLAGYCYAHAINRWLAPARAVQLHLTLLAVTCFALPIGLPASLAEPPSGDAYLWTFGVLALGVGLPFLAVSANAPLLQAWFARTGHAAASDPYFLYAASNLGSLLALLAYPLLVEPSLGLLMQSRAWALGFALLCVLIGLSAMTLVLLLGPRAEQRAPIGEGTPAAAEAVDNGQRALWTLLAFVPSGLMVAVTTYVSTDLASAPFLWVVPLALFLATFIVVFRQELAFPYAWLHVLLPVAAVIVILAETSARAQKIALTAALVGFLVAALICHRELYLRRPGVRHLTEFYIWMSVGGVLGGVFSALLAPRLFTSVLEFKLLLLAAMLLRPGVLLGRDTALAPRRLAVIVGAGAALLLTYGQLLQRHPTLLGDQAPYLLATLVIGGLILIRGWPEHRFAIVLAAIIAALHKPGDFQSIHVERSFFGTHRVISAEDGRVRGLMHGTTLHGTERIAAKDGTPVTAPVPATYYHADGPMARGLRLARDARHGGPLNIAVVGLGAGSMACHRAPADALTYYEIDPSVERIARDPRYFSFLARCAPQTVVVIGDARLTLARAAPRSLDYLVIDAFSSDSIPVHLLTLEAIEMYLARLADDGIVAFHISNRHLELAPALAATLDRFAGIDRALLRWQPGSESLDAMPSIVMLAARRPGLLDAARAWPGAQAVATGGVAAWSDDFSDILSALVANLRR